MHQVCLWDLGLSKRLLDVDGQQGMSARQAVSAMAVDWSSKRLLTCSPGLTVWDLGTGEPVCSFGSCADGLLNGVTCAAMNWELRSCVTGDDSGRLRMLSLEDGRELSSSSGQHTKRVLCLDA